MNCTKCSEAQRECKGDMVMLGRVRGVHMGSKERIKEGVQWCVNGWHNGVASRHRISANIKM